LKENSKKNIIFTVFVSICLFAIIYGGINAINLSKVSKNDDASLNVQAVISEGLYLNAQVQWEYYYTKCGHTENVTEEAENDMIGKTGEEIASIYAAELVSYEDDKIVLKKTINGYCPGHYILKKSGDYISIYKSVSGSEELVLFMKTDVSFSLLSKDLKAEIEEGKAFDSIEEFEYFLEDIDT